MKPNRRLTGVSNDGTSGAGSLVDSGSVAENPYTEVTPAALATARASICSENQSQLPAVSGPPICECSNLRIVVNFFSISKIVLLSP